MVFHSTQVIGNLGGDPELRYLDSGTAVCNFSVAVTERWRDRQSEDNREKTTWYRVNVWGNQAEACNSYLAKGRQVFVAGTVEARGYLSGDGEVRASLDLRAREVKFLGGAQDNSNGQTQQRNNQQQGGQQKGGASPPENPNDIPF